VQEAMERQRVHDVFARFVGEQVVDDVLERAGDDVRLGGERRECTVMFSDLRGFTSFGEATPPDLVISILNAYLTEMSDAILDNGGTLISYMGDGIMAVFGAPLDQPDHRDRALATAREMLTRLDRFNERMRGRGVERPFQMGIGIKTGEVMCGNVGSERRLEYTAIGDTTNTAARLEGMTKGSGYAVFVADSTRSGLLSQADDLELVADMPVRGRSAPVRVWGLRTAAEAATLHAFPVPVTVTRAIRARGDAMYLDRLKNVPFFGNLSKKELTAVAKQTDEIDVPAGKVLIRQGDIGHEFFVIEDGTAEVAKDGQKVSELKAGDFFGEMALLEEDRRTATVTASTPMTLIVMTRADFRAIDKTLPQVHQAVSEAIAQRRGVAAN
jgi:class 3 adenylate cyclase